MDDSEKKPKVILGDGNAFAIMGKVTRALKKAGREDEVEEYLKRAKSGDYDNLLRVTMDYVDIRLEQTEDEQMKEWEEEED